MMIEIPDWDALLPAQTKPDGIAGTARTVPPASVEADSGQGVAIKLREQAGDDRRRCTECAHLTERGLCLAAYRGEIVALRSYTPIRNIQRRCEQFKPLPFDPDQRDGWDRWPGLIKGNQAPEMLPATSALSTGEK